MDMRRVLRGFVGDWGGRLGNVKLVMAADGISARVQGCRHN